MKELMIVMAAMMPATDIAQELSNALQDYLLFPNDEDKKNTVLMHCNMFLLNNQTGGTAKGAKEMIDKISSAEAKMKMFETNFN